MVVGGGGGNAIIGIGSYRFVCGLFFDLDDVGMTVVSLGVSWDMAVRKLIHPSAIASLIVEQLIVGRTMTGL